MEKNRKIKLITIMALIVAVVGMSIGFAVFSNVLTISSTATVTPSEEDFKISVYGLVDSNELNNMHSDVSYIPDLTKWSKTDSYQIEWIPSVDSYTLINGQYNATINNSGDELRIQNVTGNFTSPGEAVLYYFIIKNEGAYDAYVNMPDVDTSSFIPIKSCVPGEGATPDLVQDACDAMALSIFNINSSRDEVDLTNNYKLNTDDFIIVLAAIVYLTDFRADGPFTMEFADVKYEFSTAPKS